ncbi:MAG: S-layer homology domain-containing protein [Anaerolineales bacterium]
MITLVVFFFGDVHRASATSSLQAGTTRYVAPSGTDAGNCGSSASPCRTVQYAVNQAASGDRILVAQGTYTYNAGTDLCSFLLTRAVVCMFDKRLTILGGYSTSNWSTANPAANPTVIDGQNTRRGVAVVGISTTTTFLNMEGFTIQNGRAQGPLYNGVSGGRGGGMWAVTAAVILKDMVFRNNRAVGDNTASGAGGSADGAGLSIDASPAGTGSLLQRVTFEGNQSLGGVGPERGGVAFGALFIYGSSVTVEDATFTSNLAQAGNSTGSGISGGLHADALGGAIAIEQSAAALSGIVATNNQVTGGNAVTNAGGAFGGAIFSENATSFVMTNSYISGNTARAGNAATGGFGAGGGVLVLNSPTTIERVQLISNSAIGGNATGTGNAGPAGGGGLYLWRSRTDINPSASVTNVIVADNLAAMGSGGTSLGGGGGGIQVQGLTATFSHATIARNRLGSSLSSGQGLLVLTAPGVSTSAANVSYSIIADHTQGKAGAVAVHVQQGNTVNFNRGLFAGNNDNSNAGDGGAGTFNGLASMLSASSAGFVSPGSPNFNYHLQNNSAAKDQATGSTITTDIDGQGRPFDGISDLGADEYSTLPPPTFADVSTGYWAYEWIERLYAAGITGGCGTGPVRYCPDTTVTRDQMAVFLLRGIHNSSYSPPAVGGSTGFGDVPTTYWAAAWIKQLAAEGITGGCGAGNYCPTGAVTRDQMAVFLLKDKHGASYVPPAVGGSTGFSDVPATHWAAAWIKQLAAEGITGGCGAGIYCPESPVTRAQMAVFLVRTFNLP